MRIVPAVDIRGGLCVNLIQGDFAQETVFSDDPVAQAHEWRSLGADLVHIVDLDGAKAGHSCVLPQLRLLKEAGIPFEIGGGIRDLDGLSAVIEAGAERVIIGTAAHRDPQFFAKAVTAFPGYIVVGIDAKEGKVALNGWAEVTDTALLEFAHWAEKAGASRIVYTDILSDGMMKGPNVESTQAVAEAIGIPVTASGGVSSLEDIRALRGLKKYGVDEVIVGRALYLKAFSLEEAIEAAKDPTSG